MRLNELKVCAQARVLSLDDQHQLYRQRLLAIGLVPGTVFKLMRKAPLGDPLEICVRGTSFCLRKQEAAILEIEEIT